MLPSLLTDRPVAALFVSVHWRWAEAGRQGCAADANHSAADGGPQGHRLVGSPGPDMTGGCLVVHRVPPVRAEVQVLLQAWPTSDDSITWSDRSLVRHGGQQGPTVDMIKGRGRRLWMV